MLKNYVKDLEKQNYLKPLTKELVDQNLQDENILRAHALTY